MADSRRDDVPTPADGPRTSERGRVCAEPGCGTRLSIYNPGELCFRHAPMVIPRIRGRKEGD